ncbi:uncharacterized protein LKV04_020570 [Tautogolabrus adspersus]
MAAASGLLSEDQFLCSICLDVFTDPVTIPCGHNFCKACITEHWSVNVPCQCPLCKELYKKKPDLRVNTFISEMAAQFRLSVQKETSSSSEEQHANTGEVLCDYCTETKQKALKSCLDCLVSYCETHLEPHQRIQALKRHKLIEPVENLESRICKKHERPLDQFCKTDQVCVCGFCTESEHKRHNVVSLREEYEAKKAELGETEAEFQKMIKERRVKIEDFKQSVKLSKEDADRETTASVQAFTALIRSVEEGLAQLIDLIKEKHNTTEKQAEVFIKELEEEISELTKRNTEVEQLSRNKDPLQFLQNFSSLKSPPPTKDWSKVKVRWSYEGRKVLRTALAQLQETLTKEVKKMCSDVELKTVQQFAVDVTLDPETAHRELILSNDGKQISHASVKQMFSDSSKRFLCNFCVVGKQSFSSGRFYYEVQVGGKTDWLLGVVRESINRKTPLTFSSKKGLCTVWLNDGNEFVAYADHQIHLRLKSKPQKVGVFVDYEEGLVSFYDVDAPALIYSFTGCNFTEKLYPIFNPRNNNGGRNSTPLIICPVNNADYLLAGCFPASVSSLRDASLLDFILMRKKMLTTSYGWLSHPLLGHAGGSWGALGLADMAAVSSLLYEDQFLCSICLDVFTDPVTIPCGHNFCKTCITEHWSVNVPCQCPLCKELYEKKPDLRVNTVLSEMASQLRLSVQKETSSSSEEQHANTGEVLCDYCTETKQKALKSCLDCLVSYCETHLEPHQRIQALKRHKLIEPVENLESRICKKHERPLEQFCKTDQVCVCGFCTESEHKRHNVVSLREEYEAKKAELGKIEAEVQKMIKERRLKIEDITQSVKLSKEDADRETATSVQVFTALIRSVEEGLAQLIDLIMEKQNTTEKQAEVFIKELEEEISELTKRNTEVEQHSRNKDPLQFLQNFSSLKSPPPTKDWTKVKVCWSYEGTVRTALAQLEETLSREMKKLCADAEIKKYKQYSVDVTLDPETAHPRLLLSDNGKQVSHGDAIQNLPDSQKRILSYYGVLGKQSFSSGRFYYEAQVEGKSDWVLGVASESINRKTAFEFAPRNGIWTVCLRDDCDYKALDDSQHRLYLNTGPKKVGVFVNYEEGLVSFYDVDAPAPIYSFSDCNFTENLYPIFNPKNNNLGKNSIPLIICPVNNTD